MKTCSILTLAISAVLATGAAHAQFQERALRLGSATPKGHPMLSLIHISEPTRPY